MANFESVKEKVLATAGKVAEKSVSIAKVAGDKAKLVGRITKLKTEIAMEKDSAKKNYMEIGKKYHEQFRHDPAPDMKQAIEEINLSHETISKKKLEVDLLKKQLKDDFDEVVDDVKEKAEDAHEAFQEAVTEEVKEVLEKANREEENA